MKPVKTYLSSTSQLQLATLYAATGLDEVVLLTVATYIGLDRLQGLLAEQRAQRGPLGGRLTVPVWRELAREIEDGLSSN